MMNTLRGIVAVVVGCGVWLGAVAGGSIARAVTIDWVTVGNPGNANDPATGYGTVADSYQIGKYDVTISQYTDFLNAAAKSDPYSLYNTNMGTNLNIAGISRSGSPGSYSYTVINNGGSSGNRPITYVSWFDAARFANWMQNGQGLGSTETGAYTLVGGQTAGTAPAKNPGAAFYIPTENQWYKAAYYSPLLNSGSGGYYAYATQSDTAPGNNIGSGANQANYYTGAGYSVTQALGYDPNQNYLTDVGAFSNSASYYGTFDQSGNVFQWNDLDGTAGSSRGLRGGYWDSGAFGLSSSNRQTDDPSFELFGHGFRLAGPASGPAPIPEIDPAGLASVLAMITGALCCLERMPRTSGSRNRRRSS
ncbi:MAG: formylglycine-generating enzyme family protein [Planctomycetota bacterium]